MASPQEFSRNIRRLARQIEANVAKETRRAALAVHQAVVLATPVDTGRARSNWLVELGGPAEGTVPAEVPGKGGSTGSQNAEAVLNDGAYIIASRLPGQDIHITNNLPYIQRLDEGHSAQAPAGFVSRAVQAGLSTIRGAKVV